MTSLAAVCPALTAPSSYPFHSNAISPPPKCRPMKGFLIAAPYSRSSPGPMVLVGPVRIKSSSAQSATLNSITSRALSASSLPTILARCSTITCSLLDSGNFVAAYCSRAFVQFQPGSCCRRTAATPNYSFSPWHLAQGMGGGGRISSSMEVQELLQVACMNAAPHKPGSRGCLSGICRVQV